MLNCLSVKLLDVIGPALCINAVYIRFKLTYFKVCYPVFDSQQLSKTKYYICVNKDPFYICILKCSNAVSCFYLVPTFIIRAFNNTVLTVLIPDKKCHVFF